jgi:membrane-associated phospholipid phosphatase
MALLALVCSAVPCAGAGQPLPLPQTGPSDLSRKLGIDLGSFVSPGSLFILGLAGATASWSLESADESPLAMQLSLDGSFTDPAMDVGNTYGHGLVIGGGSLSLLIVGKASGNQAVSRFGGDLCRSFLYTSLASGVIKYSVQRTRPSGGPLSFPSGHTSVAFSTVPVIWSHLGWQAGVGASVLALSTGLGRMEEYRHYLSDVLAGAALGLVVGRAVMSQSNHNEWMRHLVVSDHELGVAWAF